jgi:hypothetical protein
MRFRNRIFVLYLLILFASRQFRGQETSTPEEHKQWVEIAHKLEMAPWEESFNKRGDVALKEISDAHDIHVPLCPALLSEFNGMKYFYAHTITRQYMLASAAFQIENADKAADTKATNLAAVESVLKTYQAILQQKADAKAKALDDLLKKQTEGKLKDSVGKTCP